MDYVRQHVDVGDARIIGQGAFGRVLLVKSSPPQLSPNSQQQQSPPPIHLTELQNQQQQQLQNQIQNSENAKFALKCIHPILRPVRLLNELRHLRDLRGANNVVRMHTAHFEAGSLYIVMDYIEHSKFNEIVSDLDMDEIVIYMKHLLMALEYTHENSVIHRDVKPGNFLFNRRTQTGILVDFGLASKCRLNGARMVGSNKRQVAPNNDYNLISKKLRLQSIDSPSRQSHDVSRKCECFGQPRTCTICINKNHSPSPKSGTPGFKAPEVLLRWIGQSMAIDVWSAGVILACLLTGHSPFFRDVEDTIALAEIITVLGSQKVSHAAKSIGIRLNISPKREPIDLKSLCKTVRFKNKDKRQIEFPDCAYDLLLRMLDPNPFTRITSKEARRHPWLNKHTTIPPA